MAVLRNPATNPPNEPLVGAALKQMSAVTMYQARFTCAYIYCTGEGMQHEMYEYLGTWKKLDPLIYDIAQASSIIPSSALNNFRIIDCDTGDRQYAVEQWTICDRQ